MADYEVGYGKPPRNTRFRKGQSGNPAGRRKGARGLKADLHDELNARLTISIAGQKVKDTTQRLMLRTLAARAASGNVQATRLLVDLIMQVFGPGDRGGEAQSLSAMDRALLERALARIDAGDDAPPEPEPVGDESDDDDPAG